MRWAGAGLGLILLLAALGAIVLGGGTVAYESPTYSVSQTLGNVEIREYRPYLVAETVVGGTPDTAGNEGFRILAKYIFGSNRGTRKIAMTAPVSQKKVGGTKIAMTSPVTQEKVGDEFVVQFMMPSEYTIEELPEPDDTRISFRQVPARTFAAVKYSGSWSQGNYQKHLALLLDELRSAGYEAIGEPIWARYDAPFKPWFLRRNEILTAFEAPPGER
ncbi:MAG: heme-binding protein [Deltaproteobacteria bacterium]|nr:heme-binding protein [Deltaproteobacteria bacterium]NND30449.1 heme-binding protein [Myxococcales bacterium]MBT8463813.1 heme-binding protein [Deltaproteobacteria bacterium]MBT8481004.1 heme-binding protein [Deltaproteobacteria bacterium]NNK07356.1 heme-binding protein [Myxococcales bacterium]